MARVTITLTKAEVESGKDSAVPGVILRGAGSAVQYQLDSEASALYQFRRNVPMTFTVGGQDRLAYVRPDVPAGNVLTVTVNEGAPIWAAGKAKFFFEVVPNSGARQPLPFDPEVGNGGLPT